MPGIMLDDEAVLDGSHHLLPASDHLLAAALAVLPPRHDMAPTC